MSTVADVIAAIDAEGSTSWVIADQVAALDATDQDGQKLTLKAVSAQIWDERGVEWTPQTLGKYRTTARAFPPDRRVHVYTFRAHMELRAHPGKVAAVEAEEVGRHPHRGTSSCPPWWIIPIVEHDGLGGGSGPQARRQARPARRARARAARRYDVGNARRMAAAVCQADREAAWTYGCLLTPARRAATSRRWAGSVIPTGPQHATERGRTVVTVTPSGSGRPGRCTASPVT